ncbi:unnamed protein product [Gordionus sp. m RMFG-2023]
MAETTTKGDMEAMKASFNERLRNTANEIGSINAKLEATTQQLTELTNILQILRESKTPLGNKSNTVGLETSQDDSFLIEKTDVPTTSKGPILMMLTR